MKVGTDYIHELVKYRIYIFTPPKFMRLNEHKLQYVRKIFTSGLTLIPQAKNFILFFEVRLLTV